ncbi:RtcB family protein [Catenuloplanes sp. NPDC051500]|uniref:RtcB family protein n=1 Tax=Catenuloplanes sp. NPDC051500 TaxID=3363959 RepID=UPI0037ACD95C
MEKINDRLLNWASILESKTREQAERTSTLPFIFPHVALMPDAHLGKGATVGSVIPTLGAVIPAAVGVDIGCGMAAVKTQFHRSSLIGKLSTLRESIERAIPLSAGGANRSISSSAAPRIATLTDMADKAGFIPADHAARWELQLGSLGSGNHFIECSTDENGMVWLFLHSGSRGVGNRIASHHIQIARDLMKRYWIDLPDLDMAYLVERTAEFDAYLAQLQWAQEYALLNREEMMDRVIACFSEWQGEAVIESERVSCHHNYTARETHFGREVWLSRKGAINAARGVSGLIPGSMGDASYVVTGKGNPVALNSAPHGAGRNYSRSAARRTFTRDQLRDAMKGIEYRDTDAFIDEIPQAYKPIDQVMTDASDLVEIRHTLRQFINVKGD